MFRVEVADQSDGVRLRVRQSREGGWSEPRDYRLRRRAHSDYLDLNQALSRDFGLRMPLGRRRRRRMPSSALPVQPLITENLSPEILYGYGDPAVLRHDRPDGTAEYHLAVTSNDAPHSFPLLRSTDLLRWEVAGFAFPPGAKPAWAAADGAGAEYWSPEIHRVGEGFLLCFAARQRDGSLAIGLARADAPSGPFRPADRPLIAGGVIDPHLHVAGDGRAILYWKEDSNDVWPGLLCALLGRRPALGDRLFEQDEDRRTAAFVAALSPWIATLGAMERFMVLQPLIEAASSDYRGFRRRLERLGEPSEADAVGRILESMGTSILAQELDVAAGALTGAAVTVLRNDLEWEGHLVEGVWLWQEAGCYFLFYSGNDFASPLYGIGVAVGSSPFGPFSKLASPLLRAAGEWEGVGHPSAARGPDGELRLFFHGYRAGEAGYKTFRALLSARISLGSLF